MAATPCCRITRPNRASKLDPYLADLSTARAFGFGVGVGMPARATRRSGSTGGRCSAEELRPDPLFVFEDCCLFSGIKMLLTLLTGGEPCATIALSQDHSFRVRRQAGLAAPENFET